MIKNNSTIQGLHLIQPSKYMSLTDRVEISLLNYIRHQNFTIGTALPSQTKLTESLGVSSSTLRETLSKLEERGIIKIEHGKGTFINRIPEKYDIKIDMNLSTTQMIIDQGLKPGTKSLLVTEEELPKNYRNYFGGKDSKLKYLFIQRVRTANEEPFVFSEAYLHDKFQKFKDYLSTYYGSIYDFINKFPEETIVSTVVKISAELADEKLSEKLMIGNNSQILVLEQVHYNKIKEALIISREYYPHSYINLKVKIYNKY